jgi:hypothetical protein
MFLQNLAAFDPADYGVFDQIEHKTIAPKAS